MIAIRGAELANQIWMRQGCKVIMLAIPLKKDHDLSWNLSRFRRLDFNAFSVMSTHPTLTARQILDVTHATG
ncbi:MAG: hypothetical protein VKN13_05545 [Cyanobacteriota bacterium]|nr:hypothetical protein [Cyanobacteriota bacterium]